LIHGGVETKNGGATTDTRGTIKMMEDQKLPLLSMQSWMALMSTLFGHPSDFHDSEKCIADKHMHRDMPSNFGSYGFLLCIYLHFYRSQLPY